jgi:hypothetical protein
MAQDSSFAQNDTIQSRIGLSQELRNSRWDGSPFRSSIPPPQPDCPPGLPKLAWLGSCCTALRHTAAAQGVIHNGFPHLPARCGLLLAAPGAPRACQFPGASHLSISPKTRSRTAALRLAVRLDLDLLLRRDQFVHPEHGQMILHGFDVGIERPSAVMRMRSSARTTAVPVANPIGLTTEAESRNLSVL